MKKYKQKILKYIEDGYITKRSNKNGNLMILNYTCKCQFERKWNKIITMCRGLIIDNDWNIVERPFPKFFNLGEYETKLPQGKFDVFEKMDGSLGILYFDNNIPFITTKGSFESEQAIKGTEMLKKYNLKNIDKDYTYLFEIIYKENKIIVDYGDEEKLVLLAKILTKTGNEVELQTDLGFEIVKKYNITKIKDLKKEKENKEGYVLKWENNFRLKIKFTEYLRLHKLISGVNEKKIWDILRNGDNLNELLNNVPDEFYNFVKGIKKDLETKFEKKEIEAKRIYDNIKNIKTRKEQAIIIFKKYKELSSVVFLILDNDKKYKDKIWELIKPQLT